MTYATNYINFSTIKTIGNVRKRHSTKLRSNVITQWAMTKSHALPFLSHHRGTVYLPVENTFGEKNSSYHPHSLIALRFSIIAHSKSRNCMNNSTGELAN